jgi:hypothetical protein
MFDNARDANQYLANTVCYWDGTPVYIERVRDDFMASGYKLPLTNTTEREAFNVLAPEFNCRNYNLGYMNSTKLGRAVFVSRRPVRGVSQGICDNNLQFSVNGAPARHIMGINTAMRDRGFTAMLQRRYPTREEALAQFSKPNVPSVAVSPWVAIKKHDTLTNLRFLEYRGREISFSETHEFVLPTEFEYLREICGPTGVLRAA